LASIFSGVCDVTNVELDSFLKYKAKKKKESKFKGDPDDNQTLIIEEKNKREEEKKLKPKKESFLKSGYAHVSFKSDSELEKFKTAHLEDFEKKMKIVWIMD